MMPDKAEMQRAGFGGLTRVPFVLGPDWVYHDQASWFLRDRALLAYTPGFNSASARASGKYPTPKSLEAFGRALINFLEWCQAREVDWRCAEYTKDLVEGYQAEMERGSWSAAGSKLSPSTVNGRVGEATHFLDWAAQRGLREPFAVATIKMKVSAPTHRNAHGHEAITVEVRAGRVRPAPSGLRLPTDIEAEAWLRSVNVEKGRTKALMCELVLKTGIRRQEACEWRVDTLPRDRSDWAVRGAKVTVKIMYGTKGSKIEETDGSQRGPERSIVMPLELAERFADYRELVRPGNRATFVRQAANDSERRARRREKIDRLFLSDDTGEPVKAGRLYEAWTSVSRVPFKGWSPHGGRHYWACKTLIAAIERHRKAISTPGAVTSLSPNWISGCATDAMMLEIKPQLGHVDVVTSEKYIGWVTQTYEAAELHDAHLADLEGILISDLGTLDRG